MEEPFLHDTRECVTFYAASNKQLTFKDTNWLDTLFSSSCHCCTSSASFSSRLYRRRSQVAKDHWLDAPGRQSVDLQFRRDDSGVVASHTAESHSNPGDQLFLLSHPATNYSHRCSLFLSHSSPLWIYFSFFYDTTIASTIANFI